MSEQKVTNTVSESRDVITLFITVKGQQVLTRAFRSAWVQRGLPREDPNNLGREVEREFHRFCRDWGVARASALTVYEQEERITRSITETDVTSTEVIRNTYEHEGTAS